METTVRDELHVLPLTDKAVANWLVKESDAAESLAANVMRASYATSVVTLLAVMTSVATALPTKKPCAPCNTTQFADAMASLTETTA